MGAARSFQVSEFCNQFHQTYFMTIEQEIFAVLTDTFHKPGFKLHVLILQHLFCLVSGAATRILWFSENVAWISRPLSYFCFFLSWRPLNVSISLTGRLRGVVTALVGCGHSRPSCISKQHGFCLRLHHQAFGELVPQHDSCWGNDSVTCGRFTRERLIMVCTWIGYDRRGCTPVVLIAFV